MGSVLAKLDKGKIKKSCYLRLAGYNNIKPQTFHINHKKSHIKGIATSKTYVHNLLNFQKICCVMTQMLAS